MTYFKINISRFVYQSSEVLLIKKKVKLNDKVKYDRMGNKLAPTTRAHNDTPKNSPEKGGRIQL